MIMRLFANACVRSTSSFLRGFGALALGAGALALGGGALGGCAGSNEPAAVPAIEIGPATAAAKPTSERAIEEGPATPASAQPASQQPAAATGQSGAVSVGVQTPSPGAALAETLFQEARAAVSAGDYATACAKFDASYKIDPGLGTLFNLADCTLRLGDRARACGLFARAEADANAAGQPARAQAAASRRAGIGCGP